MVIYLFAAGVGVDTDSVLLPQLTGQENCLRNKVSFSQSERISGNISRPLRRSKKVDANAELLSTSSRSLNSCIDPTFEWPCITIWEREVAVDRPNLRFLPIR